MLGAGESSFDFDYLLDDPQNFFMDLGLPETEPVKPTIDFEAFRQRLDEVMYQSVIVPYVAGDQQEVFRQHLRHNRGHWSVILSAEQAKNLMTLVLEQHASIHPISDQNVIDHVVSPLKEFIEKYRIVINNEAVEVMLSCCRERLVDSIVHALAQSLTEASQVQLAYQAMLEQSPPCPQLGRVIANLIEEGKKYPRTNTPNTIHPALSELLAPANQHEQIIGACYQAAESYITRYFTVHRKAISLSRNFSELATRCLEYPGVFCTPMMSHDVNQIISRMEPWIKKLDPENTQVFETIHSKILACLERYTCIAHENIDLSLDGYEGEPHHPVLQKFLASLAQNLTDRQKAVKANLPAHYQGYSTTVIETMYLMRLRVMYTSLSTTEVLVKNKICLLMNKEEGVVQCQLALAVTCQQRGLLGIYPFSHQPSNLRRYRRAAHPSLRKYIQADQHGIVTLELDRHEIEDLKRYLIDNDKDHDDHVCIKVDSSTSILKRGNDALKRSSRSTIVGMAQASRKRKAEKLEYQDLIRSFSSQPPRIFTDELSQRLYPYQLDAVRTIVLRHEQNVGMLLADDMGMGKTIQAGSVIKYNNQFPVIVLCPLSVLTKWPEELSKKVGIPAERILVYHGGNRSSETISSDILVTTYGTFVNDCHKDTPLARSLGYVDRFCFTDCTDAEAESMRQVVNELHRVATVADEAWLARDGRLKDLPNDERLESISQRLDGNIQQHVLAKMFVSIMLHQALIGHRNLSPQGQILNLENTGLIAQELRDAIPERGGENYQFFDATYFQHVCAEQLETIRNAIPWKGIVLDEGHQITNPNSVRAKCLLNLSKVFQQRGAFRLVLSGTPFENKIQDLWVIAEFMNPGSFNTRLLFNRSFKMLLSDLIADLSSHSANAANGTVSQHTMQEFKRRLEATFQQLNYLATAIGQVSIRRTKADLTASNPELQQTGKLPNKQMQEFEWQMSPAQRALLGQEDERALNAACRGHHFVEVDHSSDSEDEQIVSGLQGIQLLTRLAKFLDHPVLVEPQHHAVLYESHDLNQMATYIRNTIIAQQYQGNIERFIADSGKLQLFVHQINQILANDEHKILIPITSIPMAVILSVVIEETTSRLFPEKIQPEIYSGKLSKEHRIPLQRRFNQGETRVVMLSQQAGAFGIELFASHVMPYNENYNPFILLQAVDRAVRYGSPYQNVEIYSYVCDNPFSKKMSHIAAEKLAWSELFVDHLASCQLEWFIDRLKSLHLTNFCRSDAERGHVSHFIQQLVNYLRQPAAPVNPINQTGATLFASSAAAALDSDVEALAPARKITRPNEVSVEPTMASMSTFPSESGTPYQGAPSHAVNPFSLFSSAPLTSDSSLTTFSLYPNTIMDQPTFASLNTEFLDDDDWINSLFS